MKLNGLPQLIAVRTATVLAVHLFSPLAGIGVTARNNGSIAALDPSAKTARSLELPPEILAKVDHGLDRVFHGDPNAALPIARELAAAALDAQEHTDRNP